MVSGSRLTLAILGRYRTPAVFVVLAFTLCFGLSSDAPTRAETPVQIAIGATAVCALTDGGTIACWGFDTPLVRDVPDGVFADVSVGPNDACAIDAGGAPVCWGEGYAYVRERIASILSRDPDADLSLSGLDLLLPPDRRDLVQIVVHPWRHYACARTDQGEIACWGRPVPDSPAPAGGNHTDLINTGRGFCALDADGLTSCWGSLTLDRFMSDAGPFTRIATSGTGVCGVTEAGDVRCKVLGSPTAPGPPQPFAGIFRNVHVLGSQGCGVLDDGSLVCTQTHHWCSHFFSPDVEYCPPDLVRFQSWDIPFTLLYEGGPDRETTAGRTYSRLFGDQAACAITTEGEIDCWSDFRVGDPRHNVPERFRPQVEPAPGSVEQPDPPISPDDG